MAKLVIFLTEGPWQSENCEIFVRLAEAALDKGHEVEGFFYMDGVYNAMKHQTFPGGVTTPVERMKRIVDKGARICACGLSANARGLEFGKEYIDGISMGGLPDTAEMASEADTLITL